ncbi:hypothetical protein ACH4XT_02630 [Streptomyces avidinii]|uniref:hypothetical protein n=1 Tax=Streptomyces avidinii TaxID=1895 RepID=UPI0037A1B3D7
MADQQLSAPPRASSGIRHINHDHRRGYVKIGNHLAQHRELSMTAIGLATHIQSLPTGCKVTIKALAERSRRARCGSPPPCVSWRCTATSPASRNGSRPGVS